MADVFSKKDRSRVMSAVKNKGSKIEQMFEKALRNAKIRYVTHSSRLPGRPDFAVAKTKTVVFIDSCFWHGCRYHGSMPKSNGIFWRKKIARNKERDREINRKYKRLDWRAIRIWEHTLKSSASNKSIARITTSIKRSSR